MKIRSLVFKSTIDNIIEFLKYVVLPAAIGLLSILGVIKLWSWVFESTPDPYNDYLEDRAVASDNQRAGHRPRLPPRRAVTTRRPRVAATLFDTDAQSVLHTFGGQRIIASQMVASAMEIAIHNIKPNIGLISTSAGTTNAVVLREKFVLVPEHVIPETGQDHITMSFPGGRSFSFDFSEVNAVYSTANHFIVIDLGSLPKFKRMPAFSSIIRYMSSDVRTEVPDGFLFVGAQSGTTLCSIMKLATHIQGPAPTIVRTADRRFEVPECYSYRCPTKSGDCGAPLITVIDSQPIILGFHISMFLPEQLAYAGAVSKGWWEEVIMREMNAQAQIKPVVTDFASTVTYLDEPVPRTFLPRVSKLVKSDLWTEECIFKPSPLKGDFNGKTPAQRSFEKSLRPIVHPEEEEFVEAVDVLKQVYARPDYYRNEILTVEEAIFGVGDIPSFATKGGIGYPWNLRYKREDLFSYEISSISTELHDKCLQNMHQLRRGQKLEYIVVDMLKDEKLPVAKADEGKCRLFFVLPIDINITCKQVFGRFAQFVINLHNVGPVKVGHGTEAAEVRQLAEYLCLERDDLKYLTPDTAASDRSIPYVIFMQVVEVANHWYGDDNNQIRGVLAASIFCCVHVLDGVKYETRAGMPSGFYLTSVFNSLAYFIAYHSCMRQLRVVIVAIAAFGDDIVIAIDKREPITEQQVVAKIKDYGLDITGVKKDEPLQYCTPSQVVFLQRTFEKRGGIWFSPMDLQRLQHQMMWYRRTAETRTWSKGRIHEEIFRNAFHEFYQHGRQVFEQMVIKYHPLIDFYELNIGDYDYYHDCYMGGSKQHIVRDDEFSPTYGCHDDYFSEAQIKTHRRTVIKCSNQVNRLKKENQMLKFENLKLRILSTAENETTAQGDTAVRQDQREQFLIRHWDKPACNEFVPKPPTKTEFMNAVEKAGRKENESTLDYVRRCKQMRTEAAGKKEVEKPGVVCNTKTQSGIISRCWRWLKDKCRRFYKFLKDKFTAFLRWARSTFTAEDASIAKKFDDLREKVATLHTEEDLTKYQAILTEVEELQKQALERAAELDNYFDEDVDGKKQTWYRWMATKLRNFFRRIYGRWAFLNLQKDAHNIKEKKVTEKTAFEILLTARSIQSQCYVLEYMRKWGVGTYVCKTVKILHCAVLAGLGAGRIVESLPTQFLVHPGMWVTMPLALVVLCSADQVIARVFNLKQSCVESAISCILKCFGTNWYNRFGDFASCLPYKYTLPFLQLGLSCNSWLALRPIITILGPLIEEIGFERPSHKLTFGIFEFLWQVNHGASVLWRLPALLHHLVLAYGASKGMSLCQRVGIHSAFNIIASQIEVWLRPSETKQLIKDMLFECFSTYGTKTQASYIRQATALLFTDIKDQVSLINLGIGLIVATVVSSGVYVLNKIRRKEELRTPATGSLVPEIASFVAKCCAIVPMTFLTTLPFAVIKTCLGFLLDWGLPFSFYATFDPTAVIAGPICEEYLFSTPISKICFAIFEYVFGVARGHSPVVRLVPLVAHIFLGITCFPLPVRILLHMLVNLVTVIRCAMVATPAELDNYKQTMLTGLRIAGTKTQYERINRVVIDGLSAGQSSVVIEEIVTPKDFNHHLESVKKLMKEDKADLPTEVTTEAVVHAEDIFLSDEAFNKIKAGGKEDKSIVHETEAQMDSTLAAQTNIGEVEPTSADVNLTRFVEITPAETGCVPSSEYPVMDSGFEWESAYCRELERVVKIADFPLDDTPRATPYRFNGAVALLNEPYIANRFYQAVGARFDIEYQIRVVVTKFHYGQIMALVRPAMHQNQANLVGVHTKTSVNFSQDDWCGYDSVYTASQCDNVVIPLTHGPPVTLCSKWHYPFNWICCMLPSYDAKPAGENVPWYRYTNLLKFGVLDIYNLTGAHPSGMTDPRVCVWARFKNLRLFGYNSHIPVITPIKITYPTHLSVGQSGEAEELAQDSWSSTIMGVADVVHGFVRTFTNVLAFFGLSNPRREGGPTPMVSMQYPTATSYGDSPAISLSYRLDDKQPSLLDESGKNELLLSTLSAKTTYFGCEFLTNTDREFAFLISMDAAHPYGNGHVISPGAFIKRFFKLARSDIKVKFHFSASAVVNTRVWITAVPRVTGTWGDANTPYKISASPDISGDVIYEMNLPYMDESQYSETGPIWFVTVTLTTDIISTEDTEVKPIPVTIWYSFPNAEFAVSSVPQVNDHSTYLSYLPIYQARPSGRVSRSIKSVVDTGPFGFKGKMIGESIAQSLPRAGTTVHPNNHGLACSPTSILHVMKRFSTVTGIPDKPCSLRPMRPHYGTVNEGTADKPYHINYVTGGAFHMFLLMFKYVHGGTNLIHTAKGKKDIGVVLSEAAFNAGDASATPVADISHNMISAGGYMFDEGDVKMMAHVPYRARTPFSFVETPIFGKDTFTSSKKEWMFKASIAQYPVLAEAGFWGVSAADDLEPFLFIGVPTLKVTNVT